MCTHATVRVIMATNKIIQNTIFHSLPYSRIMKLTTFDEKDSVLLLGEGNFSFSVALFRLKLKINITATCYENSVDKEAGKKNIEYLKSNGVHVLLGIDATNLQDHPILKKESFDKIIFNFPHVGGKMRIEKNRELLKRFFISVEHIIRHNGQVLVTLCNGQGGTPMDHPQRRWDDSWKITDMAAHGNLILRNVEPFTWSYFPNYVVTGYRSLEKQFHSAGALVHIFIKSEPPSIQNIIPKDKINITQCKNDSPTWKDIINHVQNQSSYVIQNKYAHLYMLDITFACEKNFNNSHLYIVLYNYAGCIIHNVDYTNSYLPPMENMERRTYRISYQSDIFPLYRARVISIHHTFISNIIEEYLNVTVIQ